jgi:hypothetical protein
MSRARTISVQLLHVGIGDDNVDGLAALAIAPTERLVLHASPQRLAIPIPSDSSSGLYVARVDSVRGTGYAPVVLRPVRPGTSRVAIVLPTNTWAAYNFRDADRNGYGDTWYADPRVHTVVLGRAFLGNGLPQHLGGFARWAGERHLDADFYSDEDINRVASGDWLASSYNLIVFSSHEEYVTQHMFSIVSRYRDLGGNLAFLSANNFYSRVTIRNGRMTCLGHFRDFGEPEAQLVGVQYVDWFHSRYRNEPYVVRSVASAPWLFRGTHLAVGRRFGFRYGVEIDATSSSTPRGIRIIAELPSIFGPGKTAQMTFYRSARGAKVFAAGAMNFESPQSGVTDRMLQNLLDYLSQP